MEDTGKVKYSILLLEILTLPKLFSISGYFNTDNRVGKSSSSVLSGELLKLGEYGESLFCFCICLKFFLITHS